MSGAEEMLDPLLAGASISISQLKKNSSAVIGAAGGFPIVILNRNTPSAYSIPAKAWEDLVDCLEELKLATLVRSRAHEVPIPVAIDEL